MTVWDCDDESVVLQAADRVRELHRRLSAFSEDSDIAAVNAAAGQSFVKVHKDTLGLIQSAKTYAALTGGVFDPTIRPLVTAWGFGANPGKIPTPEEISKARSLTDYKDILIDHQNGSVMLRRPDMSLDLGGIAKGFAVDEAHRILVENGVTDAVINLGGSVSVIGGQRAVGIRHPDRTAGTPMGRLWLSNQSAVTSGSYEKSFAANGKCCHHLLDPRTGYPAESGLKSATLIGDSALELDALTTAVFILGAEKGSRIAEAYGLQAVFITIENQVLVSAGLRKAFSLIEKSEVLHG